MNWKSFLLGAAAGFIGGYAAKEIISQKVKISPERILENVKSEFKEHGPIQGSWIHMKAEDYEKSPISYRVYKGGISRNNDGKTEQFEFIADAATGTVVELKKIE